MSNQMIPRQGGVALIESLIAIIIFSFGILGLVGLQARAIKQAGDAKLRGDASYLVNQIISQMWVDRSNVANYAHMTGGSNCEFTGTAAPSDKVTKWLGDSEKNGTVYGSLPNAQANITVDTGTNGTKHVTVTLCWRSPQETTAHNFTSKALISG